jgi:hypothetical protein
MYYIDNDNPALAYLEILLFCLTGITFILSWLSDPGKSFY